MRLSVSIMAPEGRDREVYELRESLDYPARISDGAPGGDREQVWRVGRKAWELHDAYADYHLVLGGDAVVVPGLVAQMSRALAVLGPLGLFSGHIPTLRHTDPDTMAARDRHRLEKGPWVWSLGAHDGLALCAPTSTIPEMLSWADGRAGLSYEARVGRYYRDILGWRCWLPFPSLVGRRGEETQLMGDKVDWTETSADFHYLIDRGMRRFAR